MAKKLVMYVGCFTTVERGGIGSGGISVYERQDDCWIKIQQVEEFNPSYICLSEDGKYLYGVQGKGRQIYAYVIEDHSGKLTFINRVEAGAGLACEVCNGFLYAAADSVQIYSLQPNGAVGDLVISFVPAGAPGPVTAVQHAAQPHHIIHDTQKQYFAVPCRGYDQVGIYFHDRANHRIENICTLPTYGGSYPRHIAFHPTLPVAYQLLERYGMVLVCRYKNGLLTPVEIQPTVPKSFTGLYNAAGEISVHPSGRFLGISNRGHNSIAMFRISGDGRLTPVAWMTEGVSIPRFFTFNEDGSLLYCANIGESPKARPVRREMDAVPGTGSITIYSVDQDSGHLTFTGKRIETPAPSCVILHNMEMR